MDELILKASNITHQYEEETIIEDISFTLKRGEIVGLLGVSGVGKTTLFQVLSGLIDPTAGHIFLEGEEITGQAGKISYMLQSDLLLPHFTIEDNVSLPLRLKGKKRKEARAIVQQHLKDFGLSGTEKKYPSKLSGGMRQRAALLRTYLFSQKVALLDEPFSALDAITKGEMHLWYLNIMEQINMSTIFITHDIDEAIMLSNRILILTGRPGKLADEILIVRNGMEREEFQLSVDFLNYKREIMEKLK